LEQVEQVLRFVRAVIKEIHQASVLYQYRAAEAAEDGKVTQEHREHPAVAVLVHVVEVALL
jgi:hypothetical protein